MYTVSARVRAINSGITTQPPRKLKPCSTGMLHSKGVPNTRETRPGTTISSARELSSTGKRWPVASRLILAQRTRAMIARITSTRLTRKGRKPSVMVGAGMYRPRLLRKKCSPMARLWRGPGMGSITAKYQKKICSSGGMLRKVSM
ncbi:hypothetical protein D3C81_1702950 [compost metagenome]